MAISIGDLVTYSEHALSQNSWFKNQRIGIVVDTPYYADDDTNYYKVHWQGQAMSTLCHPDNIRKCTTVEIT